MKTTKIYVGYHFFPVCSYGAFEMTLKEPLDTEVAKQKAREFKFTPDDFVENLQEKLAELKLSCTYAYFLDENEAKEWGFDYCS